jgi:hypothetical protein
VREGDGGVPLLERCPRRFVLRRETLLDEGGDHVCVSGRVVSAEGAGDFRPFRLSQATDWDAGHASEERPEPPTERASS